jgi:hypothetical protein
MHEFTAPPHSSSSEASRISRQDRLLAVADDLLAQGLRPLEVESRLYESLSADPSKVSDVLKARRIRVFQRAVGLQGPLSRDEASNLATAVWRALRGPPDLDLERRMIIAHTRWNLLNEARQLAIQMRREGTAVTPQNLASALILAISNARPRSAIVSWFLDNEVVDRLVTIVAADVAEEKRTA